MLMADDLIRFKVSALINDVGDVWSAFIRASSPNEAAGKYEALALREIYVQILECEVTPPDDDPMTLHKTSRGWESSEATQHECKAQDPGCSG